MSGYLLLADGSRVAARDGLTLGRVAQCDVVLDDSKASRRHARLIIEGSVIELEDLGSSNGTYLNDKRITRRLLRDGDRIRIGTTVVSFVDGAAPTDDVVELELGDSGPPSSPVVADEDQYRPGGGLEGDPLAAQGSPDDDVEVLEFVDEVVTLKKQPRPAPAAAPVVASTSPGRREHGVLSYSKRGSSRGILGDDVRQMSPAQRLLVTALVVAGSLALGYVVMKIVAGV